MLKKSLFIVASLFALALNSCKDELPTNLCDCMHVQAEIMEKSRDLSKTDQEGFEKIKDQFKEEIEACEKLSEDFNIKTKGLSREEKKKLQAKDLEGCDAVLRIEELMQERMDK